MGTHFTKARAGNYFNDLLRDDPVKFFTKYAVSPPDTDRLGYTGDKEGGIIAMPAPEPDMARLTVDPAKKVAFIKVVKDRPESIAAKGTDVLSFIASYVNDVGAVPVYWLPWYSVGGIVKLQIDARGVNNPDPNIFFTAALSGCSIFIQGPVNSPTVFHAGGETGKKTPTEAAHFWLRAMGQVLPLQPGEHYDAEVNKTDYVTHPDVSFRERRQYGNMPLGERIFGHKVYSTKHARTYQKSLKSELPKDWKIEVRPWGCVAGIRGAEDGNWKFYLQENATVICTRGNETRNFARPMALRQMFPAADAQTCNIRYPVSIP